MLDMAFFASLARGGSSEKPYALLYGIPLENYMYQLLTLTWMHLGRSVSSPAVLFAVLPKLEDHLA